MAHKAPGRSHRKGLTVIELLRMFPDDATAEQWFERQRWSEGRFCPDCGSKNTTITASRRPMPYRCRDCRQHFSVRKGTIMQSSKIGLQKWAIALYLTTTGIKGTASMKLHRELGIRQATAWFMMQRIREAFSDSKSLFFSGPVEVDEAYFGGLEKNKHRSKRLKAGRGTVGKTPVVVVKDRRTGKVSAAVVKRTDAATLQKFVTDRTTPDATVYTDEASAYSGIARRHKTVQHSKGEYATTGEYLDEMVSTNGAESFWALLRRGYHGTYHRMSDKHLDRYVWEFAGRNNLRDEDTLDQMITMVRQMEGKRLTYEQLTRAIP